MAPIYFGKRRMRAWLADARKRELLIEHKRQSSILKKMNTDWSQPPKDAVCWQVKERGGFLRPSGAYAKWYCRVSSASTACT